jgi:hypothetical protein
MDLTWISVVDTAVKIGFGALITAASGYLVLVRTQSHDEGKELKERFYKLQDEKKSKYVELLAQSQELVCLLHQNQTQKHTNYIYALLTKFK